MWNEGKGKRPRSFICNTASTCLFVRTSHFTGRSSLELNLAGADTYDTSARRCRRKKSSAYWAHNLRKNAFVPNVAFIFLNLMSSHAATAAQYGTQWQNWNFYHYEYLFLAWKRPCFHCNKTYFFFQNWALALSSTFFVAIYHSQ